MEATKVNGQLESESVMVMEKISEILRTIKLPIEMHRAMRGNDCLTHWKSSECASFLHYVGIILLKHFINEEHFQNFCNLFCAVTICSASYYEPYLPVAQNLFEEFISNY